MRLLFLKGAAVVLTAFLFHAFAGAEQIGPFGLNQRVLVICVKFTDSPAPRRTAADWINVLSSEINPQILMSSYGMTSFQFERPTGKNVPADGWLQLPYAMADWPGTTDGARDAVHLADPFVDMSQYNRVFVILGRSDFGGQTTGWQWMPVHEGAESTVDFNGTNKSCRLMSVSASNEWLQDYYWSASAGNTRDEEASVIAHELGHQLDMQTHYSDVNWGGAYDRDSITPWDIMGLSPTWQDFLGWAKIARGYLTSSDVVTVGPTVDVNDIVQDVVIYPIQSEGGTRAVRIPFTSGKPFEGYVLEFRQNDTAYTNRDTDGTVLQPGVLVSLVSENPDVPYGVKDIVMENPNFPLDLNHATLRTGDVYTDTARRITITCLVVDSVAATVRIKYDHNPIYTNANIQPWNEHYESIDIWVDSEKNGWDVYKYTNGAGVPTGNGDPAWVYQNPDGSWKQNRVWVRVRNTEPDPMSNVRVDVFANSPPGMGDRGPDWTGIGSIVLPYIPGYGAKRGYVMWAPEVAAHTCLKAVIEPYAGELTTSDNEAQENVAMFETTASSPYKPVTLSMVVGNPLTQPAQVVYQVTGVPLRWRWKIVPQSEVLPEKGESTVTLTMYPPNPADDPNYVQGQVFHHQITALLLNHDEVQPIGGVEMWTHLVFKTAITIHETNVTTGVVVHGRLKQLQPFIGPIANAPVAVQLLSTTVGVPFTSTTHVVTTNSKGLYHAFFKVTEPGSFITEAGYAGDIKHASADTANLPFAWP